MDLSVKKNCILVAVIALGLSKLFAGRLWF